MPHPSICFDDARVDRIGIAEAVFCAGKSQETLLALLTRFAAPQENPILFTRLSADTFNRMPQTIQQAYDYDALSRTAFNKTCAPRKGTVAVVSAGTADAYLTHEIVRTLTYFGIEANVFEDCGVAGLWRIQKNIAAINQNDVVILVAGLDAALASVVGGLTDKPIFAVPSSVGYGVADAGKTALHSMLSSCAPGIGVFNIDNGYGAACAAARVLRLYSRK